MNYYSTIVNVHRRFDDTQETFCIASFRTDLEQEQVREILEDLWCDFQETSPDSDSEFQGFVLKHEDRFITNQTPQWDLYLE